MTKAEGTEEREKDEKEGDLEERKGYTRENEKNGVDFVIHRS